MLFSIAFTVLGFIGSSAAETRKEDSVLSTTVAGGPHGNWFDDQAYTDAANGHRRLIKVSIGPCLPNTPVTWVKFEFADWSALYEQYTSVEHGTIGSNVPIQALDLNRGDHISHVKVHTHKVRTGRTYKTRVSGLTFTTPNVPEISCGIPGNKETQEWQLQTDRGFLYFSGSAGDQIDNIQGHHIPLTDYF